MKTLRIIEIDRKSISKQAQEIIKKVARTSSPTAKADAGLSLSILALISSQQDDSAAQQLMNLLKSLNL